MGFGLPEIISVGNVNFCVDNPLEHFFVRIEKKTIGFLRREPEMLIVGRVGTTKDNT